MTAGPGSWHTACTVLALFAGLALVGVLAWLAVMKAADRWDKRERRRGRR